jgi:Resolvase, N terminal domain
VTVISKSGHDNGTRPATASRSTPPGYDHLSTAKGDNFMAAPAQPAAYIRVARAGGPDDLAVQRQQDAMLRAAARLGWPAPAVYTDTGTAGWNQPGSALAVLADDIRAGRRDAVIALDLAAISRATSDVRAFLDLCARHGVGLYQPDGQIIPAAVVPFLTAASDETASLRPDRMH